jgi:hypothetical protein
LTQRGFDLAPRVSVLSTRQARVARNGHYAFVAGGRAIPSLPEKLPGERGVGSFLMAGSDLPRDQFGWPFQACFFFDDKGPTRLVRDEDGSVLGHLMTAEGAPARDPHLLIRLPPDVATAAERALIKRRL